MTTVLSGTRASVHSVDCTAAKRERTWARLDGYAAPMALWIAEEEGTRHGHTICSPVAIYYANGEDEDEDDADADDDADDEGADADTEDEDDADD